VREKNVILYTGAFFRTSDPGAGSGRQTVPAIRYLLYAMIFSYDTGILRIPEHRKIFSAPRI